MSLMRLQSPHAGIFSQHLVIIKVTRPSFFLGGGGTILL